MSTLAETGWYRILDFVPSGCCIIDEKGKIHFWNRTLESWMQRPAVVREGTLETWTQHSAADMVGLNLFEAFPTLSDPRFMNRIQAVFGSGVPAVFSSPLNPQFFPCTRPGGRPRIQQTTVNRLELKSGDVPLVLISVMDVTDQYERGEKYRLARTQALAEAQVRRESETKLRTVLELSSDAILVGEVLGRILDANSAAGKVFRCDPSDLQGQSLLDLVNDEHSASVRLAIELESGTGDMHLDLYCIRSDGSLFPAEFSVRRFVAEGQPHFAAYVKDLTERRRSEEMLRQAQKQESLAVLAGGIAHDFNNLLGAVLGNLELIKTRIQPDASIASYLTSIETEILRASDLSRKMLAFSGKGRVHVGMTDLNCLLTELQPLMGASVQRRAQLCFNLQENLPLIEADPDQIQQALLALLSNASEAIGDQEGTITLSTQMEKISDDGARERFQGQFLNPGSYVTLRMEDTGCGISPEALPRIFDPFFTTKFAGRGLSLSVVIGILHGHKAGISVSSTLGKGTAFTLYFPIPSGQQHLFSKDEFIAESKPKTGEILLVEDESLLRETTAELLRGLGYTVSTAMDGQQAVDYYRGHPGQVALVIMDVTMPRMDGKTAFFAIKDLDPKARVVLMSGYSEHDISQATKDRGLLGFLPKPFRLAQIKETVENALKK